MKRLIRLSSPIFVAILFFATSAFAEKPVPVIDKSNGFPSGEHYNLNIIGKKHGFSPQQEQLDGDTETAYGKVVFVPENGDGTIYMESGKGKKFEDILQLRVLDNWAGDADGARIQLPKNEAGYRVYARALGKPGELTSIGLTPGLQLVQDENGNDLYYLGLVTENGFETSYQSFERRKGKSKAIDITRLFKWFGTICYFSEPAGGYDEIKFVCCTEVHITTNECLRYEFVDKGTTACLFGDLIEVYCNDYTTDPAPWIFNIAEFVEYLWTTDNKGTKLLNVRFYPN